MGMNGRMSPKLPDEEDHAGSPSHGPLYWRLITIRVRPALRDLFSYRVEMGPLRLTPHDQLSPASRGHLRLTPHD